MPLAEKEKAPILVVPAKYIIGKFPDFAFVPDPNAIAHIEGLVTSNLHTYLPRAEAEINLNWIQPIVPMVVRHKDDVLLLTKRPKVKVLESEETDNAKFIEDRITTPSNGLKKVLFASGHLVQEDVERGPKAEDWGQGELHEELIIPSEFKITRRGIVNDRNSVVGMVHSGAVHEVEVSTPDVAIRDDTEFINAEWVHIQRITEQFGNMDTWSIMIAQKLLRERTAIRRRREVVIIEDGHDPYFFVENRNI